MNKENSNTNPSAPITSNAFLENVMPQIKINQESFPLSEFDPPNADVADIPAEKERLG